MENCKSLKFSFVLIQKETPYSKFSQFLKPLQMQSTTAGGGTKGLGPRVVPVLPGSWGSVTSAWWEAQGLLRVSGSSQDLFRRRVS